MLFITAISSCATLLLFSLSLLRMRAAIPLFPAQHRPCDTRIFIRQRHGGDVAVAPSSKRLCPSAAGVFFAHTGIQGRSRTVNQQCSQLRVATLADVSQSLFPPAGMLARHQPEPGRHLPAAGKLPGIAHRRNQGAGADRTDSFDFQQAPDPIIFPRRCLNALVVHRDTLIDSAVTPRPIPPAVSRSVRSSRCLLVFQHDRQRLPDLGYADGTTMPNSPSNPRISLANAVRARTSRLRMRCSGLHDLLLNRLDRDKPHVGPPHRFANRFRIVGVVLAAFDVGLTNCAAINLTQ